MAQQHPNIDVTRKDVAFDPNGVPYYKWPPFPDPPDGVNIIPFSEFKPSGIKISFDDGEEVDGLGIPTVRLAVTHDNEAPPKKKKKIKKNAAGEEVRQRNVWWEEWEEGEAQRIQSIKIYDQGLHAKSRVAHAVEDFKRLHDWQSPSLRLHEWYAKLLYFLGLNDFSPRPRFGRNRQAEPEPEEDADDEEATPDAQQHAGPAPIKIENFDEEKYKLRQETMATEQEERLRQKIIRVKETQEIRLDAFIDNPYVAATVFFSSYFRDSGMMWEKTALRDVPRILEFFLNFLLQTRAVSEEEASVRLALEIARKAKVELPLTMTIGVNMPDKLARCLTTVYGGQLKKIPWPDEPDEAAADAEFKALVEESGGIIVSDLASATVPPPVSSASATADTNVFPQAETSTGGWSSIGVDLGNWGAEPTADGVNTADDNPWAANAKQAVDVWEEPDVHSLMALLGPTMLPITHTVGYVEESTRYIASVTLPDENKGSLGQNSGPITSSDLFLTFARVELNAYSSFAPPTAPRAAIQPPELIKDPWSGITSDSTKRPRILRHNPKKDSIIMLIDPEVAKNLELGKGMGLGGTFVQIVPNYETPSSDSSVIAEGEHAEKMSERDSFWYAEKILQVIPSFWREKTF